jgi:hypothetical protein
MAGAGIVAGGEVGIAAAPAIGQAIAFGPAEGRLFWTLGTEAEQAAVNSGLGRVIGQTVAGRAYALGSSVLSRLGIVSSSTVYAGRRALSGPWASGAAGEINVFINGTTARAGSIWSTTELPALQQNPSVNFPLVYHYLEGMHW